MPLALLALLTRYNVQLGRDATTGTHTCHTVESQEKPNTKQK